MDKSITHPSRRYPKSKRYKRSLELLIIMATQDLNVVDAGKVMCVGKETAYQYSAIARYMLDCKTLNGAVYKMAQKGLI